MIPFERRKTKREQQDRGDAYDLMYGPDAAQLHSLLGDKQYLDVVGKCLTMNDDLWKPIVVIESLPTEPLKYKAYIDWEDLSREWKHNQAAFTKEHRSTFRYWLAHWCAVQMTAISLNVWSPRYLLHDIEKPWLMWLWKGDYKRVQQWHRKHAKHHLEYGIEHDWHKVDWEMLMVDWEASHLTKRDAPLDARETLEVMIEKEKYKPYAAQISHYLWYLFKNYDL